MKEILSVRQKEDENIWVTAQHVNLLITPNSRLSSMEYNSCVCLFVVWRQLLLTLSGHIGWPHVQYLYEPSANHQLASRTRLITLWHFSRQKMGQTGLVLFNDYNLSQLPICCSLLSTSLLIPLLFLVFCFALVTPLIEFGRYLSKTTSTLAHLICPKSEKQQKQWNYYSTLRMTLHLWYFLGTERLSWHWE